jgi:ankyrin repeat protein
MMSWQKDLQYHLKNKNNLKFLSKYTFTQLSERITQDNQTSLHLAAKYYPKAVQPILNTLGDQAPSIIAMKAHGGLTPLHFAAQYQPEAVQPLLDAVGDQVANIANMQVANGWTLLHFAAQYQPQAVQPILNVLGNQVANIARIATTGSDFTPLHFAAQYQPEAVQPLLDAVGDQAPNIIAIKAKDGWTPLHFAAQYQPEAVQPLLDAVGDQAPNIIAIKAKDGWTPLHFAAQYQPKAVQPLLDAAGDQAPNIIAIKAKDGWTPLHLAVQYHPKELLQAFIENSCMTLESLKTDQRITDKQKEECEKALVETVYFPKLVLQDQCNLSPEEKALCIKHKNILKRTLLSSYGGNEECLQRAVNASTSLGEIFATHQGNKLAQIFNREPQTRTATVLQKKLQQLQKSQRESSATVMGIMHHRISEQQENMYVLAEDDLFTL